MKKRFLIFFAAFCSWLMSGCSPIDKNAERGEYIKVYTSADAKTAADEAWLPCAGGTTSLYVRTNVPFEVKWQDGKLPAWARVGEPVRMNGNLYRIDVEFDPLYRRQSEAVSRGLYERRDGVLMLTNSGLFLGRYFVLHQGLTKRLGTDFSWLTDGYDIPNKTIGETLYQDWTSSQKAYGYSSTAFEGQKSAWCYAKKGYVRLGNEEGMGADFILPAVSAFAGDSLLVLSFAAVAQVGAALGDFTGNTEGGITPGEEYNPGTGGGSGEGEGGNEGGEGGEGGNPSEPDEPQVPVNPGESGGTETITPMSISYRAAATGSDTEKDASKLRIEISGGGFIRSAAGDKATSLELELGHYDPSSPSYPADIFEGQRYLVFIEGDRSNPLSGKTCIRFVAGDISGTSTRPNRVFLDDIYVYRMWMNYRKDENSPRIDMDEDIYKLNSGTSGPDMVLGGASCNE